ncbi:stress transcription factor B-2a [Seminavis robusta]|uniref:Stress transcription factor B-2a n=1 Tax=Seminavis robusta TaxID=568900 RepID=A0A9N8HKA0_9STRA|nr:stress transcription factor B-2a [Seminavis robusta]|eukprot:Sro717_g191990.1 stress transcription factor B-2a (363) ;mRNA; f:12348-13712
MASHNSTNMFPSSTAARMQEEIKRLQQLQRLRAATAACSFPNPSGGATSLLTSSSTNNGIGNNGMSNELSSLSSMSNNGMVSMNNMNSNVASANASGACFVTNPALASFLAAQQQQQKEQDETRLMLLQRQIRLNTSNGNAITNSPVSTGPTMTTPMSSMANPLPPFASSRAMAANMLSENNANNSLASTMTLSQQQLLQQQQLSHQATTISSHIMANRGPLMRVGAIEPFPEKLHRMLMEVEQCGRVDVISFINNGRGFAIHKPDTFFKEIVPLYFRHSRLSSFKRQLNLYGFEQINIGPFRGGYYHEMFHRDRPEVCRRMRRVAVKVSGATAQKKKEQEAAKAKAEKEANQNTTQNADAN